VSAKEWHALKCGCYVSLIAERLHVHARLGSLLGDERNVVALGGYRIEAAGWTCPKGHRKGAVVLHAESAGKS
jgi:hypothetical protein